jgi:DNA excision repair protein ERCC-2
MSEIEKALAELKALMKYRAEQLGHVEEFRGLGLTSRKNLCLHPSVKREKSGAVVDARCRSLTAGFVKEKKERGEEVDVCIYHDVSILLDTSCHRGLHPGYRREVSTWTVILTISFVPRIWICSNHTISFQRGSGRSTGY